MNQRQNEIANPESNTYEWLLTRTSPKKHEDSCPNFLQWAVEDHRQWYWISGNPGSGKSTLLKLLAESDITRKYLQWWESDVQILRHYFWKPEGGMKCSLKGLWCSILHQLLNLSDELTDWVLNENEAARQKAEHHDWSLMEIKSICLRLLVRSGTAYCIFVDGLDEISDEDGSDALLKALDHLQGRKENRIKLCVSSRLEYRFLEKIKVARELKLHFVNKEDMRKFAWKHLKDHLSTGNKHKSVTSHDRLLHTIVRRLLSKAEGVFLWLVIAVQSVLRGLRNKDSEEEILLRVEQLPSDLKSLYQDMWNRMNIDEPVYSDSAAVMLSFMIKLHKIGDSAQLLEMGFLLNLLSPMDVLEGKHDIGPDKVSKFFEKAERAVSLRSAGLLKVSPAMNYHSNPYCRKGGEGLSKCPEGVNRQVTFIHRTAYDYLTSTAHGRAIT
ncbi:hypothetical protein DM02DRAFT_709879, partial [Periconia macrospinosa]